MILLFLVVFISMVIVPNVTSHQYTEINRNPNYKMFHDRSRVKLWKALNKWKGDELQNDDDERRTYPTLLSEPAPEIKFRFRTSKIDPRPVDQSFQTSIIDHRNVNKQSKTNIVRHQAVYNPFHVDSVGPRSSMFDEPPPIIHKKFPVGMVDPRTVNIQQAILHKYANEPAPKIKNPFPVRIVDPRTVDVQPSLLHKYADGPAPKIHNQFPVGIVDPRTVNLQSLLSTMFAEPAPIIKYPFPVGIVDERTVNDQPVFATEPAPAIKKPFPIGIVDPRTVDIRSPLSPNVDFQRKPIIKYRF